MTCFRLTAALARKLISKTQDFCVNHEDFFRDFKAIFVYLSTKTAYIGHWIESVSRFRA